MEKKFRDIAREMILAGVKVADPRQSIKDSVSESGGVLSVCGDRYELKEYERVYLFGIAKAAKPMSQPF